MLRADSQRKSGFDPETRDRNRMFLAAIAIGCTGIVLFLGWNMVDDIRNSPPGAAIVGITFCRFVLLCLCSIFTWRTWQLSMFTEGDDLSLAEIVRRDQIEAFARACAVALIILPLALPAILIGSTVLLIPVLVATFFMGSSKIYQNQLLWTLAVGVKNDLDLADEVEELLESMRPKDPMFRIIGVVFGMIVFFPVGVPLLISMMRYDAFIKRLERLSFTLRDGMPLHQALELQSQLFTPDIVGAIEAAEQTGTLKAVLPNLAWRQSHSIEDQAQTGGTTSMLGYAWIVITVTISIQAFVMYFIVPKFKMIFLDFGVDLPLLTKFVIAYSDWFVEYWYLVFPLLFAPFFVPMLAALLLSDQRAWLPGWLLNLFPRFESPSLLQRLAYAVDQSTPMQSSLHSLANATPDFQRARRFERLENRLNTGEQIGTALYSEGFINTRESHSLINAEEIGHLGLALQAISRSMEERQAVRARSLGEFIKPFVTLTIGLMVATFCIGMFVPIVKLLFELS